MDWLKLAILALAILVAGPCIDGSVAQGRVIHEDEYGWDCRTMGNHICGPRTSFGLGFWLDEVTVLRPE